MRELKFRAWDGEKMIDPHSVRDGKATVIKHCNLRDPVITGPDGSNYYRNWDIDVIKDYPVMQFTGLQDKNGVDIFDEDILLLFGYIKAKVSFFHGCFYAATDNGSSRLGVLSAKSVEVIGNIHENPELLETKNVK